MKGLDATSKGRAIGLLGHDALLIEERAARDLERRLGASDRLARRHRRIDGGAETLAVGVGEADVPEGAVEEIEEVADEADPQTGGQTVADLMARLQVQPSGGGRRRRRDS